VPSEQFSNNGVTTLIGGITDVQTTLTVSSNDNLPSVTTASGDWFYATIDNEIVKVTNNPTTLWTIERGNQGTIPVAHSSLTPIYATLTKQSVIDIQAAVAGVGAATEVGTYAALPAAGTPGRLYLPTDRIYTYRDNGSSWDTFFMGRPVTPPPSQATFTWVNQGTATATDVGGTIELVLPTSGGNNVRGKVIPYTPGTTVEIGVICYQNIANFYSGGMLLTSAGAPLITHCYATSNNNFSAGTTKYNSVTSFNGGYTGTQPYHPFLPIYLRYFDDGATTRTFSVSHNLGCTYTTTATHSRTDFTTLTNVGFGAEVINGSLGSRYIIFHWKVT
jgi:hypothetical protein